MFYSVQRHWYSAGSPRFESWQVQEIFFPLKTSRRAPGPTQPPVQWVGAPSPGSKVSMVNVEHKPYSIAKVKNEWGCTSSPCVCLHGSEVWFTQFGHICKILFHLFLPFLWWISCLTILVFFLCILFISQILNLLLFSVSCNILYVCVCVYFKTNYPDQI